MRLRKKYRITLEDEASLEKKVNFSASGVIFALLLIGFTALAALIGIFILASTPLKNHLPGYLKESERSATEEQHLRLDSLTKVYEVNEAYVKGILSALNPSETEVSKPAVMAHTPLNPDSLMPASSEEKDFMEKIRERDKYNITYASPAAAQSLMFTKVNSHAVLAHDTENSYQAEYVVPQNGYVAAVADGKVISVASSPKFSGAYEVIIQHPKGFVTKTGRLSNLMVKPGDKVVAGQAIATATAKNGAKPNRVVVELWHDGDPLLPSQYLNN